MGPGEVFDMLSQPAAIGAASALVFGGALIDRGLMRVAEWRHAKRLRESTMARVRARLMENVAPGVREDEARVPVDHPGMGGPESRVCPQPHAGSPLAETTISPGDTWAAPRVHDGGRGVSARVQMGPAQQMAEFLAWVRAEEMGLDIVSGRYLVTRTGPGWVTVYQRWANGRAIQPMPELTFLRLLSALAKGAHAGVEKDRVRMKHPQTGAVLRNANNVPLRENVYTILEAVRVPEPARRGVEKARRAA